MAVSYSVETCEKLARSFEQAGVARPMRVERYEPGQRLAYDVTGIFPARRATVRLTVEKFVGGGFAGQVYRVKIDAIEPAGDDDGGPIDGLNVGGVYAMKILIPPSASSERFRNLIYAVGFQSPFSLQVNPAAQRAGALWQKLIRRAAGERFGTEEAVCDILVTFVDPRIGSCGELSEWIDGRTWRFEVDDHLEGRKQWHTDSPEANSPEYVAKKRFMRDLVRMLHEMGAPELARQYEWWTCKSQPNCLKRRDAEADPKAGLTAVDFRAGLALLPFLPMSPGDVKLIAAGVFKRGSLVQFDRGNLGKLRAYVAARPELFGGMADALAELERNEREYRDSMIDVTHNHVRLLCSPRLWGGIFRSAATGWRIRNIIDEPRAEQFGRSKLLTLLFAMLGLLGLAGGVGLAGSIVLAIAAGFGASWSCWPLAAWLAGGSAAAMLLGRVTRTLWGRADLREHYGHMFSSRAYFGKAVRAHITEGLIPWLRAGRVSDAQAERLNASPGRYFLHKLCLAWMPAGLHRFCSDGQFAKGKLRFIFVRPMRLYFDAGAREQWMRDMIDDGAVHGMLTDAEADHIRGRLNEPYIQKYLKCLAVHICTLPITQIVSMIVAIWIAVKYGKTPRESWAYFVGILALFQVMPISPGSLTRGLFGVYIAVRERNYRDYKVAVWLGFWKYIGYLAFPIQMAYRFPALARFMAGRWATGAVHVLPVFGERGALAEHAVFDLFYNRPLTLRRRLAIYAERRAGRPVRWWAAPLAGLAAFWLVTRAGLWFYAWRLWLTPPDLQTWWLLMPAYSKAWLTLSALVGGFVASRLAGGALSGRRVVLGGLAGLLAGLAGASCIVAWPGVAGFAFDLATWDVFVAYTFLPFICILTGAVGGALAEVTLREPSDS